MSHWSRCNFSIFGINNLNINGTPARKGSYMYGNNVDIPENRPYIQSRELFPNPTEGDAMHRFEFSVMANMNLSIVNLAGQEVHLEIRGTLPAGVQEHLFHTDDLA